MARKKKEQIRSNMSQVRNSNSVLERTFCIELNRRGLTAYVKNDKSVFGKPDFSFKARKVAVFCDNEFWHGYDWKHQKKIFKTDEEFWIPKIERNMTRDIEVTAKLTSEGW